MELCIFAAIIMEEKILILDFGSQYTQLIARRLRELQVYSEIYPFNHFPSPDASVKGVILSGSPFSVNDPDSPRIDLGKFRKKLPILGVCYGAQLMAHEGGGKVQASNTREYGRANLNAIKDDVLFKNIKPGTQVWMSHGDTIKEVPAGFEIIAGSSFCCSGGSG